MQRDTHPVLVEVYHFAYSIARMRKERQMESIRDRRGKSVEISCYLFGIVIHSSSNYEAKYKMPCVSIVLRGKEGSGVELAC